MSDNTLLLILSLHAKGLGYRRIAHKLNQKGIRTHKGSVWGGNYVYAFIKRHKERLKKTEFRNKKYPIIKSKMWVARMR